jgi:hypothetical protein
MNLAKQMLKTVNAQNNVLAYSKDILDIDWLYPEQRRCLKQFYDPKNSYTDFVGVIGMRSGKTTMASIMASFEGFQLISMGYPCRHYQYFTRTPFLG